LRKSAGIERGKSGESYTSGQLNSDTLKKAAVKKERGRRSGSTQVREGREDKTPAARRLRGGKKTTAVEISMTFTLNRGGKKAPRKKTPPPRERPSR